MCDFIHGLVKDCSISNVNNGDTAILHLPHQYDKYKLLKATMPFGKQNIGLNTAQKTQTLKENSAPLQSGTKPNLVAKILATNFGVFFVIYLMFSKICSMWV